MTACEHYFSIRRLMARLSLGMILVAGLCLGLYLLYHEKNQGEVFEGLAIVLSILSPFPILVFLLLSGPPPVYRQKEGHSSTADDGLADRLNREANQRAEQLRRILEKEQQMRRLRSQMAGMNDQELMELFSRIFGAAGGYTNYSKSAPPPRPRPTGPDPYQVLGIRRTASSVEIKKAYRARCREYHPDLHAGDPKAEERFKEIQQAYDLISA